MNIIKKLLPLVILLSCEYSSFAQERTSIKTYLIDSLNIESISESERMLIDSALTNYRNCISDSCKIIAITHIVENSWNINVWPKYNLWLHKYIKNELNESTSRFIKGAYASTIVNIGYYYNVKGDNSKALKAYEEALEIQEEIKDSTGISETLINSAYIFLNQGLLEEALDNYYLSLQIEEDLNNPKGIATVLNAIGYIYYQQKNHSLATRNYRKSLTIRREIKDQYGIATCLNNLGLVAIAESDYKTAKNYLLECLSIQKEIEDTPGVAITLSNLGQVMDAEGERNQALNYYKQGLSLFENQQDLNGISSTSNLLANLLIRLGRTSEALDYAKESLESAERLGYPKNVADAAATLSAIYSQKNQWQKAHKYLSLAKQMNDSLINKETINLSAQRNAEYEYEKKILLDSINTANLNLQKDIELTNHKEELRQANKLKITLVLGLLVVSILALFTYLNYQELKKANKKLSQSILDLNHTREQLVHSEKLSSLGVFTSGIAHEINNPINYISGASHILFRLLEEPDRETNPKDVEFAKKAIQDGIDKVQKIITSLRNYARAKSDKFVTHNIVECMEDSLTILKHGYFGKATLEKDYPDQIFMTIIPGKINQLFTNLLTNAIDAISKGDIINISMSVRDAQLTIIIADTGIGISKEDMKSIYDPFFTTKEVGKGTGLGLYVAYGIVQEHEGTMNITSKEGEGTTVTIMLPMKALDHHNTQSHLS